MTVPPTRPHAVEPLARDAFDVSPEGVRERFRWARAGGHPRYVWPDVPVPSWRASLQAIAATTSAVMRDAPPSRTLDAPAGPRALGVAAFTSGMGPLLGWWIEAGRVLTDVESGRVLALHLAHARERARRADELVEDVLRRFGSAGIGVTLLKGAHSAHALFPEPGTRPFQDVDVLVAADRAGDAEAALRDGGYTLRATQRGPRRTEWLPPGSTGELVSLDLSHADNPLTLDVHASLRRDVYGIRSLDLDPREEGDVSPLVVAGCDASVGDASVLDGPLLAILLAVHASLDLETLQLLRLVELAFLARRSDERGGFGATTLERAKQLGALRFTYPAVALTERLIPGTVAPAYLNGAREDAPRRMRAVVGGLEPHTAQRLERVTLEERLMAARGPAEVARRLLHMAWPASAGGSPAQVARTYAERALRVIKGRAGLTEREP